MSFLCVLHQPYPIQSEPLPPTAAIPLAKTQSQGNLTPQTPAPSLTKAGSQAQMNTGYSVNSQGSYPNAGYPPNPAYQAVCILYIVMHCLQILGRFCNKPSLRDARHEYRWNPWIDSGPSYVNIQLYCCSYSITAIAKFFVSVKKREYRDYILIMDMSGSMAGSRWRMAKEATMKIAPFACQADPDGITLYLFNRMCFGNCLWVSYTDSRFTQAILQPHISCPSSKYIRT